MKQNKPTVKFLGTATFYAVDLPSTYQEEYSKYTNSEGRVEQARVFGLDHPRLGKDVIHTSIVVKKNDDGSFETLNTLYVPFKETHES